MKLKAVNYVQYLDLIVTGLLVMGGLNWGLVSLFGVDMVASSSTDLGETNGLSSVIYGLVGLAACYALVQIVWLNPRRRAGR